MGHQVDRRRPRRLEDAAVHWARRVAVTAFGGVLLGLGLVMLVTPGPGWAVIAAGLALLGTEYAWARRALVRARRQAIRATRRIISLGGFGRRGHPRFETDDGTPS